MSCAAGVKNFRLLDGLVGWDPYKAEFLTGLDSEEGMRLRAKHPEGLTPAALLPYLLLPRLARGCRPCEWYLLTPAPPRSRLLHRDPCHTHWIPMWEGWCEENLLVDAVAVATWRHRIAVADQGAKRVWIWAQEGLHLAGEIALDRPVLLAFTPAGHLLVTTAGSDVILRYSASGDFCGAVPARLPTAAERLAVGGDCAMWVSTAEPGGVRKLWRAPLDAREFLPATLDQLRLVFPKTELAAATQDGFCRERTGPDGVAYRECWSWFGRCLEPSAIEPPALPALEKQGQLLSLPLDSGVPRCRWHRVRIDADVPPGCSLELAVATSEEEAPAPQGSPAADPLWAAFEAGLPHPQDWQAGRPGASDFLIDLSPGRFLFVRLRLAGDGFATPVVRRIRLDFPRSTSLDYLPAVYRENPEAEDFTERFLSLFDSLMEDLDSAIERAPALLDVGGVPDEVLPWLAGFFDITLGRDWSPEQRRAVLREVPRLYRLRGTVEGLKRAVELVFGVTPEIQELAAARGWGGLRYHTILGSTRVFGRASSRFHVGRSRLCAAPLRSYGNPDLDPLTAEAFRIRLLVPRAGTYGPVDPARLARLVNAQKPAHTLATAVRTGGAFVLGGEVAVGVDTAFEPLPAPVLGQAGNVRLRLDTVLWPGRRGPAAAFRVGETSTVGVHTVME